MTFEDLLLPLGVGRFLSEYWGKKALHLAGSPAKYAGVFSLARFQEVLDRGWPRSTVARAVFDGKGGPGGLDPQLPLTSGADARHAYRAGATICIDRLEGFVPELALLCESAKATLGYPGDVGVHAYWSPGGAGFRPHIDARVATTLQLDGRKRWRFSKAPIIDWPRDNAVILGGEVRYGPSSGARAAWETPVRPDVLADVEEVTLVPGDLLCLPAGVVHSAEADESSFAINLHFNPVDPGAYLGRLLTHALGDRPEWRNVPPLFANGLVRDALPGDGTDALAARLREAVDVFTRWLGDLESLHVDVATELLGARVPPEPGPPRRALAPSSPVSLAEGLFVCSSGSEGSLVLVMPGQKVEATGSTAAVLRALVRRRHVRAMEIEVPGIERETVLAILAQLEQAGIVRAGPPVE